MSAAAAVSDAALVSARQSEAEMYSAQHPNDARLAHKGNVRDIDISDVTISLATGQELLSLARITLREGAKYGMVGRNGCGKSTLLRRMASNRIGGWPTHLRCHLVEQEIEGSDKSALQTVIDSDTQRTSLLEREKKLLQQIADQNAGSSSKSAATAAAVKSGGVVVDPETELAQLYDRLALIDADSAESRAAEVLDEMQFSLEMQARPTKHLSGGWRMRC